MSRKFKIVMRNKSRIDLQNLELANTLIQKKPCRELHLLKYKILLISIGK